jgi:hypothetical protein
MAHQSPSAPDFDPRIIEAFAERLYQKASAFLYGSVVCGVVVGMSFGAVPLTSLGAAWPIPSMFGFATMLLGGILGGVIGYTVGDTRAFGYKLQAQSALCQLELERNSAEAAYWLQQLVEGNQAEAPRASAAPSRPEPAPVAPSRPGPPPSRGTEPPLSPPLSGPPVAAAR